MKKLKNFNRLIVIIFFSIIFLLGSYIFSDYGISIDEDNSRLNGFVSLKYILELINSNLVQNLEKIIDAPKINNYFEQGNGVTFDLPFAFFELIFKINDPRQIFLLKHFLLF